MKTMDIPNMFVYYSKLAIEKNSLNFGQGFPNLPPPDILKDNIKKGVEAHFDNLEEQYTYGPRRLLKNLSSLYSKVLERELKWDENFLVGSGATTVLAYVFLLLQPEDEAVLIEPYFPWFSQYVVAAEAKLVLSRMQQKDSKFVIDYEDLEKKINEKTRLLVLNSPQNPSGTVLDETDFEQLKRITDKYPELVIVSDEAYEFITFNRPSLPRISKYKDLFERVISVHSGGKTFFCTGWRAGYCIGPKRLIDKVKENQRLTSPLFNKVVMDSIDFCFEDFADQKTGYAAWLREEFIRLNSTLLAGLKASSLNFKVIDSEGGFFILVDISESIKQMPIGYFYSEDRPESKRTDRLECIEDWKKLDSPSRFPDEAFCMFLTVEKKVTPLPCNTFYNESNRTDTEVFKYIRFANCKMYGDIVECGKRLA